eukprot:scaffold7366_cov254-Pinguiococcus_pyrenoidosus.AAC.28
MKLPKYGLQLGNLVHGLLQESCGVDELRLFLLQLRLGVLQLHRGADHLLLQVGHGLGLGLSLPKHLLAAPPATIRLQDHHGVKELAILAPDCRHPCKALEQPNGTGSLLPLRELPLREAGTPSALQHRGTPILTELLGAESREVAPVETLSQPGRHEQLGVGRPAPVAAQDALQSGRRPADSLCAEPLQLGVARVPHEDLGASTLHANPRHRVLPELALRHALLIASRRFQPDRLLHQRQQQDQQVDGVHPFVRGGLAQASWPFGAPHALENHLLGRAHRPLQACDRTRCVPRILPALRIHLARRRFFGTRAHDGEVVVLDAHRKRVVALVEVRILDSDGIPRAGDLHRG